MKPVKMKKCQVCKIEFAPFRTTQKVCSANCAHQLVKQKNDRAFKAETRRRRQAAKSRNDHIKDAQVEFNKFIRLRDANEPCISCGRHHKGQYHAGHYRTVGANPELRFEELNCHKQCSACNNHLSGNIVNYRINLVKKIGAEKVAWLEGPHEAKHYSIKDAQELRTLYRKKVKQLQKELRG